MRSFSRKMIKGQVLGGDFIRVVIRHRTQSTLEIGELLIGEARAQENVEENNQNNENNKPWKEDEHPARREKMLLQVYDLLYGSQISDTQRELISGMKLEENVPIEFMDPHLRNYTLALSKSLISFTPQSSRTC